jgi:hypothetical protein
MKILIGIMTPTVSCLAIIIESWLNPCLLHTLSVK